MEKNIFQLLTFEGSVEETDLSIFQIFRVRLGFFILFLLAQPKTSF